MIEVVRKYDLEPVASEFAMHTHDSFEIYYFVSGCADYWIESRVFPLVEGDVLFIRKGESHHLILKDTVPYERYVINFTEDEFASFADYANGLYSFLHFPDDSAYVLHASDRGSDLSAVLIRKMCRNTASYYKLPLLMTLLCELHDCFESCKGKYAPASVSKDTAGLIAEYIVENLSSDLTLESICDRFFISKTTLNRLFRRSTGSTVWEYITIKRLLLVRELVKTKNVTVKDAALSAGFREYTTFYKSYVKHFGENPIKGTAAGNK